MSITLIQLISEQTMQNLVPLLALRPAHVVHLATPKTAARSAQIVEAARQAQVVTELESVRLSEMPSIPEVSRAVLRAVEAARSVQQTPVINFTGGTKLMSIGAYEAAMREQVTSLYVDTDHQQFLDGHSGPKLNTVLGDDFSFTPFQKSLTVNAIAVANGRQRVTGGGIGSRSCRWPATSSGRAQTRRPHGRRCMVQEGFALMGANPAAHLIGSRCWIARCRCHRASANSRWLPGCFGPTAQSSCCQTAHARSWRN